MNRFCAATQGHEGRTYQMLLVALSDADGRSMTADESLDVPGLTTNYPT